MSSSSTVPIRFFFQGVSVSLSDRTDLKAYLLSLFKKEGRQVESVNYIFCTDAALLIINRQYLKHDFYTDIVTFDLSEGKQIRGEIYISIDRVKDNSKKLGCTFKSELHRVIFHGALHLCGYNDKKQAQKTLMRHAEDLHLKKYFS